MSEFATIKEKLIDDMWLSVAVEAGRIFRPTLRKNKKLKVLTLTNDKNFREVTEFIRNRISRKDLIFGWNKARSIALRLDCEGKMGTVYPGATYEDSLEGDLHDVMNEFPFDIMNLDFSSQNPEDVNGRIEKEIHSIEKTLILQKEKRSDEMALIYTTLLDSNNLSINRIKRKSDGIDLEGWDGIIMNGIPSPAIEKEDKIKSLENILNQIIAKYNYELVGNSNIFDINLPNGTRSILSIAVILRCQD